VRPNVGISEEHKLFAASLCVAADETTQRRKELLPQGAADGRADEDDAELPELKLAEMIHFGPRRFPRPSPLTVFAGPHVQPVAVSCSTVLSSQPFLGAAMTNKGVGSCHKVSLLRRCLSFISLSIIVLTLEVLSTGRYKFSQLRCHHFHNFRSKHLS
jgi:hypothetical protein